MGENRFDIKTTDCKTETFVVGGLKNSTEYTFLIQACIDGVWSSFNSSDFVSFSTINIKPVIVSADASGDGQVTISWNPVQNASCYAISECLDNNKFKTINVGIIDTTYTISDLSNNKTHRFLVQSCVNGCWSKFSDTDYVEVMPTGQIKPYSVSCVPGDSSIQLSWGHVSGAQCYSVCICLRENRFDIINALKREYF